MDQELLPGTESKQPVCLNCGSIAVVAGPNPLCADCRSKFIKFPVPNAVKIFAAGIAVVFILSMIRLPKNLSAGLHLERGKKSEKKGNYLTAQREFEKVLAIVPDLKEAKSHLLISSARNFDYKTLGQVSQELEGKSIEDQDMYDKMTEAISSTNDYFPSDSFNLILSKYPKSDSIPDTVYRTYISAHPEENFPKTLYASILYNKDEYAGTERLVNDVLQANSWYIPALSIKAGLKRELGQFDSAFYYAERILAYNKESILGISSKARIYLKQKKDKDGLQWALKAYDLDKDDSYSISTLALAYHYTNNIAGRDQLIARAKSDSSMFDQIKYVTDIISGKEKFRD